jgi:hypothetical protein
MTFENVESEREGERERERDSQHNIRIHANRSKHDAYVRKVSGCFHLIFMDLLGASKR